MAKRARDDIDEEYAADFIRTAHNPNRWRLAFDLLNQQTFETVIGRADRAPATPPSCCSPRLIP